MNLEDLRAPFHSSRIHWRVGTTNIDTRDHNNPRLKWGDGPMGIPLAYLDARDVMERLDAVCGMGNWQCDYPWSDGKKVVCRIGIKIDGEWIWKSNGAGETQVEQEKGALSDAFKRAGVLWGIGQDLYGVDMGWRPLESLKKRQFSAETMTKLNKDYEAWLISSEGPLKSLVERQRVLADNITSIARVIDGIKTGNLSEAAEEWFSLPKDVHDALFFAPSRGGIFDPKIIEVMRSKEFRESFYGANAA